jgi:hypothetical protein
MTADIVTHQNNADAAYSTKKIEKGTLSDVCFVLQWCLQDTCTWNEPHSGCLKRMLYFCFHLCV